MKERKSGVLLHITSLPSIYGIGDLGPSAYHFADFLSIGSQKVWQILPLNPSGTFVGSSPYASYSAFAGNPLLISPELLLQDGFIDRADLPPASPNNTNSIDYSAVIESKTKMLTAAHEKSRTLPRADFQDFCEKNSHWLDDYALFVSLKQNFEEVSWTEWPKPLRDREPEALDRYRKLLWERVERTCYFQFLFFRQWSALKEYCHGKGISIFGDMPIYVSSDSVDVWAHPELFKLDAEKEPIFVSGAPPDYFSATGQRWGSPVYDWDAVKKDKFEWWIDRIGHNLKLFDMVRLDHFRGFVAYWEIPVTEETAINGKWVKAPAVELFRAVQKRFPKSPIIAEDLGMITEDVREIMEKFQFPGMKILVFAFGGDLPTNPYIPHNYGRRCVVYTGTHDNNTIRGWYAKEASEEDRRRLTEYLGHPIQEETVHWDMIRLAMSSVADLVIIPIQDLLGLGEEARMNFPQKTEGNWLWRLLPEQLTRSVAEQLAHLAWFYNRQ